MNPKRNPILHPFLFAASPIFALLAQNLDQIQVHVGLRATLAVLLMAAVVWLAWRLLLRDWHRSAAVTSLLLVLFFSYGHVYGLFKTTSVGGEFIGRHRFLVPLWGAILATGLWLVVRRVKDRHSLTGTLNWIGGILVVVPMVQFALFQVQEAGPQASSQVSASPAMSVSINPAETPPDIYYVIFDAYTRHDVLADYFNHDNRGFLDRLRARGFYVPTCSRSNYAYTELSLTSSLNLNYLDALLPDFTPGNKDKSNLRQLMQDNYVRKSLEALGYSMVSFRTGYYWTQMEDSAYYLTPGNSILTNMELDGGLNSFELMLLRTSAGLFLADAASKAPDALSPALNYPDRRHRELLLFNLHTLAGLPDSVPSPKFVFAHIVSPHKPFVFGPNGEEVTPAENTLRGTTAGYRDQVIYINQRIEEIVDQILADSDRPPVIVLQGDHGSGQAPDEVRHAIFNAYYLPDGATQALYETISPVNTFRLIFNAYFNGQFELLEDRSYQSTFEDLYNIHEVSDPNPACAGR